MGSEQFRPACKSFIGGNNRAGFKGTGEAGSILIETSEEWETGKKYLAIEGIRLGNFIKKFALSKF